MLTLITFPPGLGEPSHSPFCAKAMILLQMSGLKWRREDIANPSSMPHGRLPVLQTAGDIIPDSEFIQDWLTKQGADLFPSCTEEQKAIGHSVIKMVEETIRIALIHDRWLDDQNWAHIGPLFFAEVPRPIRKLIASVARRSVRAGLKSNGFVRLSAEQRLQKVENDLHALGKIIGTNPFVLGGAPTAVDATVLPVLSMIDRLPVETGLTRTIRSKDWVVPYLERGRSTLYAGLV